MTSNFFQPSLLLLFLDPGSGMGKNQDPGYTSRISHTAMRIKKIIDGKSLHVYEIGGHNNKLGTVGQSLPGNPRGHPSRKF